MQQQTCEGERRQPGSNLLVKCNLNAYNKIKYS